MCTGIIALVFEVIASSIKSGSMVKNSDSISTNTGSKPTWYIGFNVVGNPAIGVITFVPFGNVKTPSLAQWSK